MVCMFCVCECFDWCIYIDLYKEMLLVMIEGGCEW